MQTSSLFFLSGSFYCSMRHLSGLVNCHVDGSNQSLVFCVWRGAVHDQWSLILYMCFQFAKFIQIGLYICTSFQHGRGSVCKSSYTSDVKIQVPKIQVFLDICTKRLLDKAILQIPVPGRRYTVWKENKTKQNPNGNIPLRWPWYKWRRTFSNNRTLADVPDMYDDWK